jgi:hypothetical protein
MSQNSAFNSQITITWRTRALLATLLLFGSEILLWIVPTDRPLLDWIPLILGYITLSSLLLDLAVRYRVRNIFGLLALAGIYGMLNGLLLNPESTLTDVPRTLITRVTGAHTLVGLLMLWLFIQMVTPRQTSIRISVIIGAVVGGCWGTWARWSPTLLRPEADGTSLSTLLLITVDVVVVIAILLYLRRTDKASDLRLRAVEWVGVLLVLGGFLLERGLTNQIDTLSLVIVAVLSGLCFSLIWFLKSQKGTTLLDGIGTTTPPFTSLAATLAAFLVAGVLSYGLPRGDGEQDPVFIVTALFTAFGLSWLPGVCLALGAQALGRLVRAGKL